MDISLVNKTILEEVTEDGFYVVSLKNNIYERGQRGIAFNIFQRVNITTDYYINNVKKFNHGKNNKSNSIFTRNISDNYKDPNFKFSKFEFYSAVPIICEYKDGVMRDLITGKIIEYQEADYKIQKVRGLSYYRANRLPSEIVCKVLKLLNDDDLKRYAKCIEDIENLSIGKCEKSLAKQKKLDMK